MNQLSNATPQLCSCPTLKASAVDCGFSVKHRAGLPFPDWHVSISNKNDRSSSFFIDVLLRKNHDSIAGKRHDIIAGLRGTPNLCSGRDAANHQPHGQAIPKGGNV